jgi:hypothetical protein
MYQRILEPAVVAALLKRLSDAEAAALNAYVEDGVEDGMDEERRALVYVTRASEWLLRWRSRLVRELEGEPLSGPDRVPFVVISPFPD